jgi:serine/threonine protein kinase
MEFDTLRMVSTLQGAPARNIIKLVAFYTWRNEIHFVFPFVEGNLHKLLREHWFPERVPRDEPNQPLPLKLLWKQTVGVANALAAIHTQMDNPFPHIKGRMIAFHFDLKPANILVTADGIFKITDFGQALIQIVPDGEELSGPYIPGDPVYAAPESRPSRADVKRAYQAHPPDANSSGSGGSPPQSDIRVLLNYDVWSLGCIMLEILIFIVWDTSGISNFDSDRKAEGPGHAFYGDDGVKNCVSRWLEELKAMKMSDPASRDYLDKVIELLSSMFHRDMRTRETSAGVVARLETARSNYKNAKNKEDPLISLVRDYTIKGAGKYEEIFWNLETPKSFLHMCVLTTARAGLASDRSLGMMSRLRNLG